jgi:hypothetical protein
MGRWGITALHTSTVAVIMANAHEDGGERTRLDFVAADRAPAGAPGGAQFHRVFSRTNSTVYFADYAR